MPDVKRQIKLVTNQRILPEEDSGVEGYPQRGWDISVYLLNQAGEEIPATIFEKATYKLHPSFGPRAIQAIKQHPFQIKEKGWGEFDMQIVLTAMNKGGDHTIDHDLNFQSERYEAKHTITFRNPKPDLVELLKESGPLENGTKGKAGEKKPKRRDRNVDMEKLADGLMKLGEDDLLQVVQMVHDNKTADTYTKNDAENGEFHIDLYTLPDTLVKALWDFTSEKVAL